MQIRRQAAQLPSLPPKLTSAISSWLRDVLPAVDDSTKQPNDIIDLNEFDVDVSDWEYAGGPGVRDGVSPNDYGELPPITVELRAGWPGVDKRNAPKWEATDHKITLFVKPKLTPAGRLFTALKDLNHELVHVVQYLLQIEKDIDHPGGMATRHIKPTDASAYSADDWEHTNADEELYPLVSDEVAQFKLVNTKSDDITRSTNAREWIVKSKVFSQLREAIQFAPDTAASRHAEKKYKKAVLAFLRGVGVVASSVRVALTQSVRLDKTAALLEAPPAMMESVKACVEQALAYYSRVELQRRIDAYERMPQDQIEAESQLLNVSDDILSLESGRGTSFDLPPAGAASKPVRIRVYKTPPWAPQPDTYVVDTNQTAVDEDDNQQFETKDAQQAISRVEQELRTAMHMAKTVYEFLGNGYIQKYIEFRDSLPKVEVNFSHLSDGINLNPVTFEVPVDLSGSRYETVVSKGQHLFADKIHVNVYAGEHPQHAGAWTNELGLLDLYLGGAIAEDAVQFQRIVRKVMHVAEHELAHVVQSLFQDAKDLRDPAGLPTMKGPYSRWKDQDQPHEQRDIEFYPNLITEINAFKADRKKHKVTDWKSAARAWVADPQNRFESVREKSIERWRKMVTEFMRAVDEGDAADSSVRVAFTRVAGRQERIQALKTKFPDRNVDELAALDPTQNGSYIEWVVERVSTPDPELKQLLTQYDELKRKKLLDSVSTDIKRLSLEQLKAAVDVGQDKLERKEMEDHVKSRSSLLHRNVQQVLQGIKEKEQAGPTPVVEQFTEGAFTFRLLKTQEEIAKVSPGNWCVGWLDQPAHFEAYNREANAHFYFITTTQPDANAPWLLFLSDGPHNGECRDRNDTEVANTDLAEVISKKFNIDVNIATANMNEDLAEVVRGATDSYTIALFAHQRDPLVLAAIAGSPKTPPNMLASLAQHPDEYVRACLAGNTSAPPQVLIQLAASPQEEHSIKVGLLDNPQLPTEALTPFVNKALAKLKNAGLAWTIVELQLRYLDLALNHPNMSEALLRELYNYAASAPAQTNPKLIYSEQLLKSIARSPKLPADIAAALFQAEANPNNPFVPYRRQELAKNSKCPPELLRRLFTLRDSAVVAPLAWNPNTPVDILEQLVDKYPKAIAVNPAATPELLWKVYQLASKQLSYTNINILKQLGSRPDTPPDLLSELAKSKNESKYDALVNPNTPIETLRSAVRGPSIVDGVLMTVAQNPSAPIDLLSEITKVALSMEINYTVIRIVTTVIGNPNASPELIRQIWSFGSIDTTTNAFATMCLAMARATKTPKDILVAIAKVRGVPFNVLKALTSNPSTPKAVRDWLAATNMREPYDPSVPLPTHQHQAQVTSHQIQAGPRDFIRKWLGKTPKVKVGPSGQPIPPPPVEESMPADLEYTDAGGREYMPAGPDVALLNDPAARALNDWGRGERVRVMGAARDHGGTWALRDARHRDLPQRPAQPDDKRQPQFIPDGTMGTVKAVSDDSVLVLFDVPYGSPPGTPPIGLFHVRPSDLWNPTTPTNRKRWAFTASVRAVRRFLGQTSSITKLLDAA